MYGIGSFRRGFNRLEPVHVPQNARKKLVPISCSIDELTNDPVDVGYQLDLARCLKNTESIISKESTRSAKAMVEMESATVPAEKLGLTSAGVRYGFSVFLKEVTKQAKLLGLRD
jgi:hypothetical protein